MLSQRSWFSDADWRKRAEASVSDAEFELPAKAAGLLNVHGREHQVDGGDCEAMEGVRRGSPDQAAVTPTQAFPGETEVRTSGDRAP